MYLTSKAEVTLEWADGEYPFALKGKQIEELQAICKHGFGAIYGRVMRGEWYYADLFHTVRLGLIGGGMGAVEANRMCMAYVDGVPLAAGPNSPLIVAQAILGASVMGVASREGKPKPEATAATSTSGITGLPSWITESTQGP